jgi:hypothetical protein
LARFSVSLISSRKSTPLGMESKSMKTSLFRTRPGGDHKAGRPLGWSPADGTKWRSWIRCGVTGDQPGSFRQQGHLPQIVPADGHISGRALASIARPDIAAVRQTGNGISANDAALARAGCHADCALVLTPLRSR